MNSTDKVLSVTLPEKDKGVFHLLTSPIPHSGSYDPCKSLQTSQSNLSSSGTIQSIEIPSFFNYITSLSISTLHSIHSLTIQRNSCQQIHSFSLISYPLLEMVHVGYNCFYDSYPSLLPDKPLRKDQPVIIRDCPNLRSLIIEPWCFVLSDGLTLES